MYTLYLVVFCTLSLLFPAVQALTYRLDKSYSGSTFFQGFDFFTDPDPTHGFVSYVSAAQASSGGLAGIARNGAAYMGVDYKSQLSPSGAGRKSVRITSKKSWTHGLFIADIAHMPGGICGTWPAFWTLGPNWPNGGEIDIIEGVNSQQANIMSLHTSPNCVMSRSPQLGTVQNSNCDGNTNQNAGCNTIATSAKTYGKGFNAGGGGVYAMEWTSSAIKIWFFPRNSVPANIKSGRPVPSSWGTPLANNQGCDIDGHFKNHKIVFDTTFCGDWAANVWQNDATCKTLASSCNNYVAANPAAFREAYWSVNSVKVYTSSYSVQIQSVNGGDTSEDSVSSEVLDVVTDETTPIEVAPSEQQVPMDSSQSQIIPAEDTLAKTLSGGASAAYNPSPGDLPLNNPSVIDPSQNKLSNGTDPYIAPAYEAASYSPLYSPELDPQSCEAQSKLASAGVLPSGVPSSIEASDVPIISPFPHPSQDTGDQNEALITFSAVQKRDATAVQPAGAFPQISTPAGDKIVECDGIIGVPYLQKRVAVDGQRGLPSLDGVGSTATSTAKRDITEVKQTSSHISSRFSTRFSTGKDSSLSLSSSPTKLVAARPMAAGFSRTTLASRLATTTPSLLPATISSSSGYTYLGCFTVNEQNLKVAWDSKWSYVDACLDTCASIFRPIAALTGSKCYCGVTGDLGILSSNSKCDTSCPGSTDKICGGGAAQAEPLNSISGQSLIVSLYQKDKLPPVPDVLAANVALNNDDVELLYEGCWLLNPSSEPNFQLRFNSLQMTRQRCLSNCTDFAYAGLYQDECYCGLYLPAQEEHSCTLTCPGDQTTECGGLSDSTGTALSVFSNPYYTSSQTPAAMLPMDNTPIKNPTRSNFTYTGCYSSKEGVPNFRLIFQSYAMTQELCFTKCPGSLLAGIHSTGCYCGDTLSAPAQGKGLCALPCPGNTATQCGGGNITGASLSVFQRQSGNSIPRRAFRFTSPSNFTTVYTTSIRHKSSYKSSNSGTSVRIHHSSSLFGSPKHNFVALDDHYIQDRDSSQSNNIPVVLRRRAVSSEDTPSTSDPRTHGPNTPFHYKGCYGLNTITGFVLSLSEYEITQPLCIDACNDNGSVFAGIHGQDCYCGSDLTASPSKDQDCNFPCTADPATYCGGFSPPSITVLQIEQHSGLKQFQLPKDATGDQKPAVIEGDPTNLPITVDVGGTYNVFLTHNRIAANDGIDADNGDTHDTETLYSTITSCPCTETSSSLATTFLPSSPKIAKVTSTASNFDSMTTTTPRADVRKKLDDTSFAIDSVPPNQNASSSVRSHPQDKTQAKTYISKPLSPPSLTPSPTTSPPPAIPSGKQVTGNANGLRFRGVGLGVWGVVLAWMTFWGFVMVVVGDWVFINSVVEEVLTVGGDATV